MFNMSGFISELDRTISSNPDRKRSLLTCMRIPAFVRADQNELIRRELRLGGLGEANSR